MQVLSFKTQLLRAAFLTSIVILAAVAIANPTNPTNQQAAQGRTGITAGNGAGFSTQNPHLGTGAHIGLVRGVVDVRNDVFVGYRQNARWKPTENENRVKDALFGVTSILKAAATPLQDLAMQLLVLTGPIFKGNIYFTVIDWLGELDPESKAQLVDPDKLLLQKKEEIKTIANLFSELYLSLLRDNGRALEFKIKIETPTFSLKRTRTKSYTISTSERPTPIIILNRIPKISSSAGCATIAAVQGGVIKRDTPECEFLRTLLHAILEASIGRARDRSHPAYGIGDLGVDSTFMTSLALRLYEVKYVAKGSE